MVLLHIRTSAHSSILRLRDTQCVLQLYQQAAEPENRACQITTDGLEGTQTAVESAMLRGKMLWRLIHGYSFEEDFYHLYQPQNYLLEFI